MPKAISNTSPLLYLHRIDQSIWLSFLFDEIWVPQAVIHELNIGKQKGYDVPNPLLWDFTTIVDPKYIPPEWAALNLGPGEVAAMSLALENPQHVVLLDDQLARRSAQAAGLDVWGTLKIMLEIKKRGHIPKIQPYVHLLREAGMWISDAIYTRILNLAGE